MEIKDFFKESEGTWFAQRTTYELDQQQSESSKSEIVFELLEKDNSYTPFTEILHQCKALDS